MSGIAGLFSFNGGAADAAAVRRMLDSMGDRGSDEVGVVDDGAFANVGYRARWTTSEARRERQPIRSSCGRLLLAYDGRLDNREELAAALCLPVSTTDGALLVELIARDGWAALSRAVGEFALAWWNSDERRAGLARDSLGMRPLYYAITPHGVVWASELQAIFRSGWVSRRPNEGFVAEQLAISVHSLHETAFDGVVRLPQAHVLDIANARGDVRRYWAPAATAERSISERDAEDELRALLRTAVRACLRSAGPVAFQASGGFDSAAVIGLARAEGFDRPAAFSMIFPAHPDADESRLIDELVRHTGAVSHRVVPEFSTDEPFDYVLRHDDLPYLATGEPLTRALLQRASADGHAVMLTGLGADQWLSFSAFRLARLIRRGRLWAASRYARDLRRSGLDDGDPRLVLAAGLLPLVPGALKARTRALVPRAPHAPWIARSFARRVDLADRIRASFLRAPAVADPVVRESLTRLTSGEEALTRQDAERSATHAGLELRHPFYDRRLVEFLLTLPDDLRFRDGFTKYVARRALRGVVPDVILARRGKADFQSVLLEIVRAAGRRANWAALRSAELGWVDAAQARALWRAVERGNGGAARTSSAPHVVWKLMGLEAWLRRALP